MADSRAATELTNRLSGDLGQASAEQLVAQVHALGGKPEPVAAVLSLLEELAEVSEKVGRAAVEALPELARRAGLAPVVPWLNLGIVLVESSGASALKYFKESPRILGVVEQPEARIAILSVGAELAVVLGANLALRHLLDIAALAVELDLRNALYGRLLRLSFGFYDRYQTGQLMSRATVDLQTVRFFLGYGHSNTHGHIDHIAAGDGSNLYAESVKVTYDPRRISYRRLVEAFRNQPVTIRTLDIGADKYPSFLGHHKEANPFLGWRGIRHGLPPRIQNPQAGRGDEVAQHRGTGRARTGGVQPAAGGKAMVPRGG